MLPDVSPSFFMLTRLVVSAAVGNAPKTSELFSILRPLRREFRLTVSAQSTSIRFNVRRTRTLLYEITGFRVSQDPIAFEYLVLICFLLAKQQECLLLEVRLFPHLGVYDTHSLSGGPGLAARNRQPSASLATSSSYVLFPSCQRSDTILYTNCWLVSTLKFEFFVFVFVAQIDILEELLIND